MVSLTFERRAKTLNVAVDVQRLKPETRYGIRIVENSSASPTSVVKYRFPDFTTSKQGATIVFHSFPNATSLSNSLSVELTSASGGVVGRGAVKVTLTT